MSAAALPASLPAAATPAGPWWVTTLKRGGKSWLLKMRFDRHGGMRELEAEPVGHAEPVNFYAAVDAAHCWRKAHAASLAEAFAALTRSEPAA